MVCLYSVLNSYTTLWDTTLARTRRSVPRWRLCSFWAWSYLLAAYFGRNCEVTIQAAGL